MMVDGVRDLILIQNAISFISILKAGLGKKHHLLLKFLSSPEDPRVLQLMVSSSFKLFFFF